MLLIIPLIISVAAGAIERGAATAIGRWAGGNIAKQYIATSVAKKAIKEARKLSMGESKDWQSAFKENPGEALRDAANDYVKAELREVFGKRPKLNESLVRRYNEDLLRNTGEVVYQETKNLVADPSEVILRIDPEKIINRTTNDIISRGLSWTENKDIIGGESQIMNRSVIGGNDSQVLNRSVIGGDSQILNRSVIGGGSAIENINQISNRDVIESVNRISTRDIMEAVGKTAFYDSFDAEHLTYTVIGDDDALAGKVRSPLEALLERAMDVSEPVSIAG